MNELRQLRPALLTRRWLLAGEQDGGRPTGTGSSGRMFSRLGPRRHDASPGHCGPHLRDSNRKCLDLYDESLLDQASR